MHCTAETISTIEHSTLNTTPDSKPDGPYIWAKKFRKTLYASGKTRNGYTPVIQTFIREINYPPKYVKPDTLRAFIRNPPSEEIERYREALFIFYNSTVPHDELKAVVENFTIRTERTENRKVEQMRKFNGTPERIKKEKQIHKQSEAYLDTKTEQLMTCGKEEDIPDPAEPTQPCLTHIPTAATMSEGDRKNLLSQLKKELQVRNYSGKTIRNYCDNVKMYLERTNRFPGSEDNRRISDHMVFLHNELGYSPRTVNLHSAALSFFYKKVIGNADFPSLFIRMKTGSRLPKVYSPEEIEQILSSITNPKHKLIVLLAYACGLRLSEIRNLRVHDIDFDRKLITIREGKGKKDRTVMLDDSIKTILRRHCDRNITRINFIWKETL